MRCYFVISGNDNIYTLTNQQWNELRFDLAAADGSKSYAKYYVFRIESAHREYMVATLEDYTGTAGQQQQRNQCKKDEIQQSIY